MCSKNGETRIETEIEGWVYGEDNKVGVSGHLVTKSGTLILKGLMAGVLQGIADSVSNTDNYFENGSGFSNRNSGVRRRCCRWFQEVELVLRLKLLQTSILIWLKTYIQLLRLKVEREVQLLVKGGKKYKVPYNKLLLIVIMKST